MGSIPNSGRRRGARKRRHAGGVSDIGRHLIDTKVPLLAQESPLVTPPKERIAIAVNSAIFDGYAGRYQLAPAVFLTVTRKGNGNCQRLLPESRGRSSRTNPKKAEQGGKDSRTICHTAFLRADGSLGDNEAQFLEFSCGSWVSFWLLCGRGFLAFYPFLVCTLGQRDKRASRFVRAGGSTGFVKW